MNAAARQINQTTIFNGQIWRMRLSREFMLQLVLWLAVLMSALAVVYSTNNYRETFTELKMAERTEQNLQLRWGQLLLEQASLATPARVQELATEKFQMLVPTNAQTVMLRLQ